MIFDMNLFLIRDSFCMSSCHPIRWSGSNDICFLVNKTVPNHNPNGIVTYNTLGQDSAGYLIQEVVGEIATDVLSRLPKAWNIEKVQEKYPTDYEESMNTVLVQDW